MNKHIVKHVVSEGRATVSPFGLANIGVHFAQAREPIDATVSKLPVGDSLDS